jgi:metal-dependent hydrolase (beta-lactamase superfamily II)
MIDTGYEHNLKDVETKLNKKGIKLSDIKYVFLTHAHDDHAGFLNELLGKNTDLKVIIVSDLHQTHAANDNQCCQSNKRINCDAIEHGFQSGFLEVGKAGIQTDGSQCSDH